MKRNILSCVCLISFIAVASSSSRNFLTKWTLTFEWLSYDEHLDKAFCAVCKTAYETWKMSNADETNLQAFVKKGFSNWKKAIEKFKIHECSDHHRKAAIATVTRNTDLSLSKIISRQSEQSRIDARHCLLKIYESVKYLAVQGIPLRGHTESESNFIQLLKLRCLDDDKLRSWMERSKYKWISHDIINEILSILARSILDKVVSKISERLFFAFMADETTDISKKEQMSANFRVVDDNMEIHEYFTGFYDTPKRDAGTLFEVVDDIFLRCQLKFKNCRGQCYDGASNVSGSITGLQTRIREIEPRALYTHCAGHNLNLVSQDAMSLVPEIADFLSMIRELITFIRASAKRLNIFNDLKSQSNDDGEEKVTGGNLKKFCNTRWCVRVKSLKSVRDNYKEILEFCNYVGEEAGDAGTKARGFSTQLYKFETLVLLELTIASLEKVEALNETIQATTVNFKTVLKRVELLKSSLNSIRTVEKFDEIWEKVESVSEVDDLAAPELPRRRCIPKRMDSSSSTAYFPSSPK